MLVFEIVFLVVAALMLAVDIIFLLSSTSEFSNCLLLNT